MRGHAPHDLVHLLLAQAWNSLDGQRPALIGFSVDPIRGRGPARVQSSAVNHSL
jgi:hypothetical protein